MTRGLVDGEYATVFDLIKSEFPHIQLRNVQGSIFSILQNSYYLNDAARVAVLAAPTGSGKSFVAEASAEYLRRARGMSPTWYVAPTLHLQQQYVEDFRRFGLRNYLFLAGRGAYICPYLQDKYGSKMNGQPFTANDCIYVTGIRKKGEECPFHPITAQKPVMDGSYPALIRNLSQDNVPWSWINLGNSWALRYFEDLKATCPYHLYRIMARYAHHVVTNYDVLLLEWARPGGPELPVPAFLVFDEAHVLFDKIANRFSADISVRSLFSKFGVDYSMFFSASDTTSYTITANVSSVVGYLYQVISILSSSLKKQRDDATRYSLYLEISNLNTFASMISSYPLAFGRSRVYPARGRIKIVVDPIALLGSFIRRYLDTKLIRPDGLPHGSLPEERKVLIMSGTVGDKKLWALVARAAGLRRNEWDYYDFSNTGFPPDIRPVYYVPLYPVTRYNFVDYADSFAVIVAAAYYDLRRLYEEGYSVRPAVVVHAYLRSAASYLADAISRILMDYGEDPAAVHLAISDEDMPIREIIDRFKESGGILVSSTGAAEGVDFRDELARLQFIFKAPIPGSDYPQELKDFYIMKTIVQMAGRVARSPTDFGATFIVDQYALRHYEENSELYPAYYRDAVRIFSSFEEAYADYRNLFRTYVPKVQKEVTRDV